MQADDACDESSAGVCINKIIIQKKRLTDSFCNAIKWI